MKFTAFKEYRGNIEEKNTDPIEIAKGLIKFLSVDLVKTTRELSFGLNKLSLTDNFESFEETLTIASGVEAVIINKLRPIIPSRRVFVRGGPGSESITDGDTQWSQDFLYLKNNGAMDATVTVIFQK